MKLLPMKNAFLLILLVETDIYLHQTNKTYNKLIYTNDRITQQGPDRHLWNRNLFFLRYIMSAIMLYMYIGSHLTCTCMYYIQREIETDSRDRDNNNNNNITAIKGKRWTVI